MAARRDTPRRSAPMVALAIAAAVTCGMSLWSGALTDHVAAQGSGDAGYDDGYVYAGYEQRPAAVTTVDRTRPRSPTRWCVHWPLYLPSVLAGEETQIEDVPPEQARELSRSLRGPLIDGDSYFLVCYRSGETAPYFVDIVVYRRREPTGATITTIETVSEFARRLVDAPPPTIATVPPSDRLVVGFETWFATLGPLDAAPRSAQAGHLWATAEPVPVAITYDLGDGTSIRCEGPPASGLPGVTGDDRPGCARHTYLDSGSGTGIGAFAVTATVTYDVWLVTSESSTPRLADTIDGPPAALPVTVREIQAVLR